VNIDHGQLVYPSLNRFAIVMDLHELTPVGRWATSGRHRWRLERIAEVCENLTSRGLSHPGLRPLANLRFEVSRLLPAVCSEPDVTVAVAARHELLRWLEGEGLEGVGSGPDPGDHFVSACAAALAAWKWSLGAPAWIHSADPSWRPHDMAC
jgi:hypothetical protein